MRFFFRSPPIPTTPLSVAVTSEAAAAAAADVVVMTPLSASLAMVRTSKDAVTDRAMQ